MNRTMLYIKTKYVLFLGLVCFMPLFMLAENPNTLFVKANKLYKAEKYNEAIALYHEIEEQGMQSAELYYNLANAYYRVNKVAPTIYNYEKALQLDPENKDILFNLEFAKRMTIDNIEEIPTTIFQKISQNYIQKLHYNSWAYLAVFFVLVFVMLFLMYHFSIDTGKKRLLFITSNLSIIFLIISLLFAFHTYNVSMTKKEAIIFAQETSIKSAPTMSGEEIFELHEGTKVQVIDSVDNWKKIKIADGQTGWIVASELKEL